MNLHLDFGLRRKFTPVEYLIEGETNLSLSINEDCVAYALIGMRGWAQRQLDKGERFLVDTSMEKWLANYQSPQERAENLIPLPDIMPLRLEAISA